jgi:small subunit ribosomal protein S13
MPRVAGIDIPREKQIWVSLQYVYGIGPATSQKILTQTGISPETKADSLTEGELAKIRDLIDKEYTVEGELRKEVNLNIKRLIEIGSYKGQRHRRNLPARGQRTRTNARTRRGTRKTVAGRGKKRGTSKK